MGPNQARSDFAEFETAGIGPNQERDFGELEAGYVSPRSSSRTRHYLLVKRALDVVGSTLLLIVLFPLMAIVAIAIKVTTPGPVFFVQERVGSKFAPGNPSSWETRTFGMFKFRSMFHEADQSLHVEYIRGFVNGNVEASEEEASYKLNGDSRVTPIGRVIRRTSIDELPQLINVLRGEMSLVGPRPVPQYEVDEYLPWHFERLNGLPGMTGLWQVYARGRVTFEEMIRLDIEYVRSQSIFLDLKLLLLTLPAVLRGSGAE